MFASLRHLPRDARDTLFVLAVIAWTILPHAAHLAPWCIALAGIILVVRARLAVVGGALPSRWTLAAVLALAVGLTLASESTLLGKEAGVTMLVVLMALKTLELRARRDAMVVFLLGFFIVLTHFLYSQSALTALAMPGGVIVHIGLAEDAGGLDIRRMTLQEITFIGTYTYTARDFTDTAQALFEGRLGPLDWVEARPLRAGARAFADLSRGAVAAPKILLKPDAQGDADV